MKLLHYVLQICILWLNYCSVVQGKLKARPKNHVPRVWNGKPAKIGQFPYQVGLTRLSGPPSRGIYTTFCGGAIIGKSKVLTAAHCLAPDDEGKSSCCKSKKPDDEVKGYRIVAGNIRSTIFTLKKSNETYQMRSINSYKYPDKYDFPELDIGFIITDKPWVFNKNVARLPYASKHIEYGTRMCRASGFGILNKDPDNPVFSERMMWEDFKLITAASCKKLHKTDMKDFICTENKEKDVTQGDSGGPLVCKKTGDPRERKKGIIVGVVCGDSDDGNFYTRVSSYTKFVDSAHKIACPHFCICIGLTLFLLNP